MRINSITLLSEVTLLEFFDSCSVYIFNEYFIEDIFCLIRKATFHFIFNVHDVLFSIFHLVAIKRKLSCDHGIKSDSQAPNINHFGVIFLSFGQFWGGIWRRATESAAETSVFLFGDETKVNKLGIPVVIKHDVLTFDIPVENSLWFQVFQSW